MKRKGILKLISVALCVSMLTTSTVFAADVATTSTTTEDGEVTIYLVRHGKTMLNTAERTQGWSDAVLTPAGEQIVKQTGAGLMNVDFDAAYSSDLGRAVQTAELILGENLVSDDVEVTKDERLREVNFGTFEGATTLEMLQGCAEFAGIPLEEYAKVPFPTHIDYMAGADAQRVEEHRIEEGLTVEESAALNWPAEDYQTLIDRSVEGINDIAETTSENGGGNVLVVSHGITMSAMVSEIAPDAEMPPYGFSNASVTVLKYKDGEYTVETINDMSYAKNGKEILDTFALQSK